MQAVIPVLDFLKIKIHESPCYVMCNLVIGMLIFFVRNLENKKMQY